MPNKSTATNAATNPLREKEVAAHSAAPHHRAIATDSQTFLLNNDWYSTNHLAARLHVDASTLRRWRTARPPQGPPFVTVSERVVVYSALDVEEWLHSRRTVPTKGLNVR